MDVYECRTETREGIASAGIYRSLQGLEAANVIRPKTAIARAAYKSCAESTGCIDGCQVESTYYVKDTETWLTYLAQQVADLKSSLAGHATEVALNFTSIRQELSRHETSELEQRVKFLEERFASTPSITSALVKQIEKIILAAVEKRCLSATVKVQEIAELANTLSSNLQLKADKVSVESRFQKMTDELSSTCAGMKTIAGACERVDDLSALCASKASHLDVDRCIALCNSKADHAIVEGLSQPCARNAAQSEQISHYEMRGEPASQTGIADLHRRLTSQTKSDAPTTGTFRRTPTAHTSGHTVSIHIGSRPFSARSGSASRRHQEALSWSPSCLH